MASRTLFLDFGIDLHNHEDDGDWTEDGPIFHRWLPNGEQDALVVPITEQNANIRFWFNQRGYCDGKEIIYDPSRREIDPTLIPLQTILHAGMLRGQIELNHIKKAEYDAVTSDQTGNQHYEALARRVVMKIFIPQITRFISVLKLNYGQYWIGWSLGPWDSRRMSLGRYCYLSNLEWSTDGNDWHPFIPNEQTAAPISLYGGPTDYSDFLTEADWNNLGEVLRSGFQPNFGAEVVNRAHRLLSEGQLKFALIESVTAAEVILDWYFINRLPNEFRDRKGIFSEMGLVKQIVTVTTLTGKIDAADASLAVRAYEMRKEVVHEGKEVDDDARKLITALLRLCSSLLPGPSFRFPWAHARNQVYPKDYEVKPTIALIHEA